MKNNIFWLPVGEGKKYIAYIQKTSQIMDIQTNCLVGNMEIIEIVECETHKSVRQTDSQTHILKEECEEY